MLNGPDVKPVNTETMSGSSDDQLVEAARDGDSAAFKELVKRYESRVAATVVGMLGNTAEADDVGQETFIRFYRALKSFRGESSVGTYLTRIAINLSLNELKRRKRFFSVFSRSAEDDDLPEMKDPKATDFGFEEKEVVQWALQKLNPEFRSVLVLRLIDGYSTEETAAILKIPLGTALSRLARAQKKMREILTPYFGGER
jgi:RNA polymerase sigma-70 factor (ECF subfamily)